jgi:CheY-like chemotaxis protein
MSYKILIVDDSKLARMAVAKALNSLRPDWERLEATNADEALALANQAQVDIALVDFNMPGRDGLDLAAELRQSNPKMPVAVISANRQQEIVDRSKAAVTVKVRFTDPTTGVLPDMAAKVSFLAKALDDEALKAAPKLVAPADAVVERGGRKVVFTIDDGHAQEVPVSVKGAFGSSGVELADGPATGTKVIRRPDEKIRDGVAVKEKKK